jgi:hypothetical protein
LLTSKGKLDFTVRALLKEQGTATVFGGSFALLDLPVAQRTFGKDGKLDLVDLTIEEGENVESVQQRLRKRLQGSAEVERPSKRGEQIELLLTSSRSSSDSFSFTTQSRFPSSSAEKRLALCVAWGLNGASCSV